MSEPCLKEHFRCVESASFPSPHYHGVYNDSDDCYLFYIDGEVREDREEEQVFYPFYKLVLDRYNKKQRYILAAKSTHCS